MIAYMCKYAPIEILHACGTPTVILEPKVSSCTCADTLMHPNLCSYVKAVLEDFSLNSYEGMLFTTCCDSSRRLLDTLKERYPDRFFFCMDLPRKVNDFSLSLYVRQIEELIRQYTAFSGKTFSPEHLIHHCNREFAMQKRKQELICAGQLPQKPYDLSICLAGARPGSRVKQLIESLGAKIALDLTCTGIARTYAVDPDHPLDSYARALLQQMPCMRMSDVTQRMEALTDPQLALDGIIYHTIKFCDIYSYEYTGLKQADLLPMVTLETDATTQGAGQTLTRIEAFLESLRAKKPSPAMSAGQPQASHQRKGEHPMYILGIDSGSTSTNAVIINEKKEILAHAVVRTGAKSGESAQRILEEILSRAGLSRRELSLIVSTGYGRVSIPFADKNVTEISCHGKGAHFVNPAVRTILDIGGQDSKAIRLDEQGDVVDFVMNDKCAAGTGRFLEMMARTLEIPLEELGPLSLTSKEAVAISSMCSVFAESEVISLIAQNKETADIAHGIHRAIATKAISLVKRVRPEPAYMMTGGVAKNPGVVRVLEELLGAPLYLYEEPEIVGALGAALFGWEELMS